MAQGRGRPISAGEPLLSVQTDKATLEVESVAAGTVVAIVCPAGEVVPAGTAIAYVGAPGETIPSEIAVEHPAGPALKASTAEPAMRDTRPPFGHPGAQTAPDSSAKILASPAARQLAWEHGIELSRLRGSGPDGRIESRDVRALIEGHPG